MICIPSGSKVGTVSVPLSFISGVEDYKFIPNIELLVVYGGTSILRMWRLEYCSFGLGMMEEFQKIFSDIYDDERNLKFE